MISKEFRAGIRHAAQMLCDKAAAATDISDGARRLCLTDMAEKIDAEAGRRTIQPRRKAQAGDQADLL